MSNLIEARGISKSFFTKAALREVNFSVTPGKIIGILGPNGSGKTTLMKILAGVLQSSNGSFTGPEGSIGLEAKKRISFLPDTMKFPTWMRVHDCFKYYQDMFEDYSQERALRLMELLELNPMDKVHTLSKGMQERVYLGISLSRDAAVYLLDEPLGGIDPVGKARIVDAILAMHRDDASILLSTHLVKDVERMFEEVYFISEGQMVFHANCDDLRQKSNKTVEQAYLEVFGYE